MLILSGPNRAAEWILATHCFPVPSRRWNVVAVHHVCALMCILLINSNSDVLDLSILHHISLI